MCPLLDTTGNIKQNKNFKVLQLPNVQNQQINYFHASPCPVTFKISCSQPSLPCLILSLYLTQNASILRWVLDSL